MAIEGRKFTFGNSASSRLLNNITADQTTIRLVENGGTKFPDFDPIYEDIIPCVIWNLELTESEIVYVTDITGDVMTIERGAEDSTASSWPAGSIIVNTMTAGFVNQQAATVFINQATVSELDPYDDIVITWTEVDPGEGNSVVAYNIYREDNGAGGFVLIASVGPTTFTYTDTTVVQPGNTYQYYVEADLEYGVSAVFYASEVTGSPVTPQWILSQSNSVWYSSTGEDGSWTEETTSFGSDTLSDIVYNSLTDSWVVQANQGDYCYTADQSDLTSWTKRTLPAGPFGRNSVQMIFTPDVGGANGTILCVFDVTVGSLTRGTYSTDAGLNWTDVDPVNSTNDTIGSVIYHANTSEFMVFCDSSFNRNMSISGDASTWVHYEKGTDRGEAATNGSDLIVECDYNSTGYRYSDDDGVNWTNVGSGPDDVTKIVWCSGFGSAGRFLAVKYAGTNRFFRMDPSEKDTGWTACSTSGSASVWNDVAYLPEQNRAIAVGGGGWIAYTDDGDTWTVYQDTNIGSSSLNGIGAGAV
jgi:hypothetical protein